MDVENIKQTHVSVLVNYIFTNENININNMIYNIPLFISKNIKIDQNYLQNKQSYKIHFPYNVNNIMQYITNDFYKNKHNIFDNYKNINAYNIYNISQNKNNIVKINIGIHYIKTFDFIYF